MKITQTFHAPDRATWRAWLAENGHNTREIWLVYYRVGTGRPSISYANSLEEALCFGWVDSIIQKIDEEKYARKFTPRKAGSKWSELNKHLVAKLIQEGRVTEAGLARVDFPDPGSAGCPSKTSRPAPAGLVESRTDDQYEGMGEFQQIAGLSAEELYRLDLGCQKS